MAPVSPADAPPPRPGIFGNDDEKSKQLARLLRSRNPTDLAAANRMIKTMVKEDNDRVERLSKRLSELETVRNNTKLLSEMLEHYHKNGGASEDTEIMRVRFGAERRGGPQLDHPMFKDGIFRASSTPADRHCTGSPV